MDNVSKHVQQELTMILSEKPATNAINHVQNAQVLKIINVISAKVDTT